MKGCLLKIRLAEKGSRLSALSRGVNEKETIGHALLLSRLLTAGLAAQADQDAFAKAKLLIFDKQWAAALKQLDEVMLAEYPGSRHLRDGAFLPWQVPGRTGRPQAGAGEL